MLKIPATKNTIHLNKIKTTLSKVNTPLVSYNQKLMLQERTQQRTYYDYGKKREFRPFKKLKSAIKTAITTIKEAFAPAPQVVKQTTVVAAEATRQAQLKIEAEARERKELVSEYETLYEQCVKLYGEKNLELSIAKIPATMKLTDVKLQLELVKNEIAYQKHVAELKAFFTRGADDFLPSGNNGIKKDPFKDIKLKEIVPDEKNSYKAELKRLANLHLENSLVIEPAMLGFKELSKNYFEHAGKSLKEIFDIKSDPANSWLERIPKVGVVFKTLRVRDQIKLSKCVLKDYSEVSEKYVQNGIMPIVKQYDNDYKTIKNYVEEHSFKSFIYAKYTKKYLSKLEDARNRRVDTSAKMLEIYSRNGANLSRACEDVKKNGTKEVLKKALFTLVSLF